MCRVRYSAEVERAMRALFDSLSERDRRLYAAAEALKLGHGGICYLAGLFGCSERTIRRGVADLADLPQTPDGRVRRKGGAGSAAWTPSLAWTTTSWPCCATSPPATPCARA
jgi:hypothetical protein